MRAVLIAFAVATLALAGCHKPPAPNQGEASKAFMTKNASEPGVQTLPSGLQFKVVREGPKDGLRPKLADEVKVHYEGKLINGTVFDSSYERGQPVSMPLRGLIPGWREALQLMRPGDEWVLYVPPALGYGDEQAGEIPPGSALVFRIELLGVLPGPHTIGQG
jgi:peptidylprolyl isomerase/FKBP-type peptidyl-prolyl cis-trans isomerase FklB